VPRARGLAAVIFGLSAFFSGTVHSADDVSKNAGICGAAMQSIGNRKAAERAFSSAPNLNLARNFAVDYARRAGKETSDSEARANALEAMRACRSIGLWPPEK
jgi:hypothetical protein